MFGVVRAFSRRSLFLIFANLLIVLFLTISFARSYASTLDTPQPAVLSSSVNSAQADPIFTYTDLSITAVANMANQKRIENGQKPLVQSTSLVKIAEKRALDMQTNAYYAHLSPLGQYFNDIMDADGVKYGYACENLNIASSMSPDAFIDSWLASSAGHKECMLNASHTKAGYAVSHIGSRNGIAVDQIVIVAIYSN